MSREGKSGIETILLVEDQAFVRHVTGEVLRSASYRVLEAGRAAEAARAYDDHLGDVDLLLADVILPGESGSALAERLRSKNPSLKVLLISGYPEQETVWGGEPVERLAKPFSTEELLRKVRELLDGGSLDGGSAGMDRGCRNGAEAQSLQPR